MPSTIAKPIERKINWGIGFFFSLPVVIVVGILFLHNLRINRIFQQYEFLNYPKLKTTERPFRFSFDAFNMTFDLTFDEKYIKFKKAPQKSIYYGKLFDDPYSSVRGTFLDGIFEGSIRLYDGNTFTLEKSDKSIRHDSGTIHFHSIIYNDTVEERKTWCSSMQLMRKMEKLRRSGYKAQPYDINTQAPPPKLEMYANSVTERIRYIWTTYWWLISSGLIILIYMMFFIICYRVCKSSTHPNETTALYKKVGEIRFL